jgi:hypothetical protein
MRRVLIPVSLSILAILVPCPGAAQQPVGGQPRRLLGPMSSVDYEATIALIDDAALEIRRSKPDRIYIVTYPGRCDLPGKPERIGRRIRTYLEFRGFDTTQLDVIRGEQRPESVFELWVGANPPPIPVGAQLAVGRNRKPFRFDVYDSAFSCELSWVEEEDQRARLDSFADILKRHPDWNGYLLAYAGRSRDPNFVVICPRFTDAELRAERAYLTKTHGIAASRIVVLRAGIAGAKMIELWLAPRGTKPPRHGPPPNDLVADCGRP